MQGRRKYAILQFDICKSKVQSIEIAQRDIKGKVLKFMQGKFVHHKQLLETV